MAGEVEMEMVVVMAVSLRAKHGLEGAARLAVHLFEKAGLGPPTAPAAINLDGAA